MAWDIKRDWELTQKALSRMGENLGTNFVSQIDNYKMMEIVNRYRREEASFYEGNTDGNSFETVAQEFWYLHYLNRARLRRLGITVHYNSITNTTHSSNRYPSLSYYKEGKNRICQLEDYERVEKDYIRNGRVIYRETRNREVEAFYLLTSQTEGGDYICPNCGAEGKLESFLDGCDSCNTKFQVGDFETKIMSMYRSPGFMFSRKGSVHAMLANNIAHALTQDPAHYQYPPDIMLKEDDPEFSEEHFYATLVNKVLSIHYAEHTDELKAFVEQDLTGLIRQCGNIMDVKMLMYHFVKYGKDQENQYLAVYVRLRLMICENEGVRFAEPGLILHMVRSLQAIKEQRSRIMLYRCRNCGAGLTLLNGGQCEFCGASLDLKKYDWVIRRVEMAPNT